ncbi:hypothetical protein HG536_0C04110 [Torulaspora globosa]|uniref:Glycoside hydrolase family 5 C-terminal domain-containing protein n=1 Tax=Torulaspora globosa TaxID=48254 RepID=A0A7G3ZFF6_9SACH|nr:uncharacterized protein HG536_0C04110 [Torulaspora globosa]QLL32242.1 hypothetical protein HG536_0C04110 [Torulaspora globosa]
MPEKVFISSDGEFCDRNGNAIVLRGVNLDPITKIPACPYLPTHTPVDESSYYENADEVSFVNHPLPLEDIEEHINRLKSLGYNCIRFPFTWEALEHQGPGKYDFEYIDYVIKVLKKIGSIGGLYVYLDPHQDVWSRFCGGSGAPLWTLYAAGFNPRHFNATEAAVLHNHYSAEGEAYPKMLWPTNYFKLACQTMFTLFFAGKDFAPKCQINGENIQDYLQNRFIDAVMVLYSKIQEKAPELFAENCIIGLETINEPNCGYFGERNLEQVPRDRNLKRGSTPTGFQSFLLGEGHAALVEQYDISIFGPTKIGTKEIDPKGTSCWLTNEERAQLDSRYGWQRAASWLPAQCIWKLHGVWAENEGGPTLLRKDYFAYVAESPLSPVNDVYFSHHQFVSFYKRFQRAFRKIDKESLLFMQGLVFKQPPQLKGSDLIDDRTVYSCHFYDGMSLMFKTWNRKFNVDTFGIVRGRYFNPAFSVVLGETNIRKCLKRQLREMKQEVKDALSIPCFFTEIGMPFDMDNKRAYKNGDFSSQISAVDALQAALEGENLSYSLWCYCSKNSHEYGDEWNNEDFSIWSSQHSNQRLEAETPRLEASDFVTLTENLELDTPPCARKNKLDFSGIRVLDAVLRPFPIKIHGKFIDANFDLPAKTYKLEIAARADAEISPDAHSFIFLPQHHFPLGRITINSSSGVFAYHQDYQVLKWFHSSGKQWLTISLIDADSRAPSPNCTIS